METEEKRFVCATLETGLSAADNLFDTYLDNFDINSIPSNILDAAYRDIEDEFEFANRNCREWVLEEGYGENESVQDKNIESTKEIINRLMTIYKFDEKLFKAFSPHRVQIVEINDLPIFTETATSVVVADICNNINIIDKEMKFGGYYRSRCVISEDEKGRSWANLVYVPIRQDTISEQIRNHCITLYHYSEKDNGEYCRYVISVDKVPKDIEFYYDPCGNGCIYTTEKIPYSSIIDETFVEF